MSTLQNPYSHSHPGILASFLLICLSFTGLPADPTKPDVYEDIRMMRWAIGERPENEKEAFAYLDEHWKDTFVPMILDVLTLGPSTRTEQRFLRLLKRKTNRRFGSDPDDWFKWWWSEDREQHTFYPTFKRSLYMAIDSRFSAYFATSHPTKIRLDEVRWGGVVQDGIPPLRFPKMVKAGEASYLRDRNVVFGLEINGDARAYPKRILAWHEMFVDEVGGLPVTGVYCRARPSGGNN